VSTPKLDAAERERQGIGHEEIPFEEAYGPIPKPGEILEAGGREAKEPERPAHEKISQPMAFDWDSLRREATQPSVRVDDLQSWDGQTTGLGSKLNEALAGGLRPGQAVLIGAPKAGGGKTAFIQQLTDGLALRNHQVRAGDKFPTFTPVMVVTEMAPSHWQYRSISRWAQIPYGQVLNLRCPDIEKQAREAAGILSYAAPFMRIVTSSSRDMRNASGGLAAYLARAVASWRKELEAEHKGCEVWPVLVVDPIQRLQSHEHGETEALNEIAEELTEAARADGFILIMTSDTTKNAENASSGAGVFRGSYKLFHSIDTALVLFEKQRSDAGKRSAKNDSERLIELDIPKNRWGRVGVASLFIYRADCGRFTETNEEPEPAQSKGSPKTSSEDKPKANGPKPKSKSVNPFEVLR
jgi:hypothetical protein